MVAFNNRSDDAAQEQERPSAPNSWDRPLLLAGLGLLLMLGGYAATSYSMAGHLAIYVGLILFVVAGIVMYRSSPPKREIDEGE